MSGLIKDKQITNQIIIDKVNQNVEKFTEKKLNNNDLYHILDDKENELFRINYNNMNKNFRYKRCGREVAFVKANNFRNDLLSNFSANIF